MYASERHGLLRGSGQQLISTWQLPHGMKDVEGRCIESYGSHGIATQTEPRER